MLKNNRTSQLPHVAFPAGVAAALLLAAVLSWWAVHGAVTGGVGWIAPAMPPQNVLAGWLMLVLVLCTQAGILVGAARALQNDFQRILIGLVLISVAVLTVLFLAALDCQWLTAVIVLQITAVLLAWTSLCAMTARLMRPLGSAMAVGAVSTLAMLLLAAPVMLMPLMSVLGRLTMHWPLALLVNACPTLWLLGAAQPATGLNWFWWSHAPRMYQLSGLGVNTPMPVLEHWLVGTVIAGMLAGFMLMGVLWIEYRSPKTQKLTAKLPLF